MDSWSYFIVHMHGYVLDDLEILNPSFVKFILFVIK